MAARSNARAGALSAAIILCVTTLCAADSVNAQISGKVVRIGVLGVPRPGVRARHPRAFDIGRQRRSDPAAASWARVRRPWRPCPARRLQSLDLTRFLHANRYPL